MMSCIQTNIIAQSANIGKTCPLPCLSQPSYLKDRRTNVSASLKVEHHRTFPKIISSSPSYKRFSPVCLAGETGNPKREDKSTWNPLKRALGGFKQERSVQDLLREQMQRQEFADDGGNGGSIGGGGDGFGGGGEDEGFAGIFDELLQVILATIGFIFVYIYLIRGAELTRLARDYVKYLFGGPVSVRLGKAMKKWDRFYRKIVRVNDTREDWLERKILTTPTWWYDPVETFQEMRRMLMDKYGIKEPSPPPPSRKKVDTDDDFDDFNDDDNFGDDDDDEF